MLEIIGGLTISAGALVAWHARKLRACCLPSYQAAAALKKPAAASEQPSVIRRDQTLARPCGEQQGAETAADVSAEKTQSCADDAAGPPDAKDTPAHGHPEEFQIGTFPCPDDDTKHGKLDEEEHVDQVTAASEKECSTPRGCNTSQWASPGRTPEHYCIASFISGAEADEPSGSLPPLLGGRDLAAANTSGELEAMIIPRAHTIRICGRTGKYYELEITGSGGGPLQTYKLHRRYREFASLDQQLRDRYEGLPSLPRKSIFTKHVSPGFLLQRERGLQEFMNSVMEADPNIQDPTVKAFLDPTLQVFPGGDFSRSVLAAPADLKAFPLPSSATNTTEPQAESEVMSQVTASFTSARQ